MLKSNFESPLDRQAPAVKKTENLKESGGQYELEFSDTEPVARPETPSLPPAGEPSEPDDFDPLDWLGNDQRREKKLAAERAEEEGKKKAAAAAAAEAATRVKDMEEDREERDRMYYR